VWIGYLAPGGTAHFARVDGQTGTVEETIVVPGWNGQGYSPYGAALDPEFRPWFGGLRGEFIRINTDQNPITITASPRRRGPVLRLHRRPRRRPVVRRLRRRRHPPTTPTP
jgi:hypothetical protein